MPAARSPSPSEPPTSDVSATSPAGSPSCTSSSRRRPRLPDLLFEIGCEELPARACREALEQLPALVEAGLGTAPAAVWVGPRRLAIRVEGLPEQTAEEWIKGPPVALREKAAAGFAKRHGIEPE